jgi:hypothetical protein
MLYIRNVPLGGLSLEQELNIFLRAGCPKTSEHALQNCHNFLNSFTFFLFREVEFHMERGP